ncbi:MAG: anthranilate phosphoribosyltransferase [Desulforhopalus sp.]
MDMKINRKFGQVITRLLARQHLSEQESYEAFCLVLSDTVSEMQQGAFLAALTGKGETAAEVAGGWRAVYELDTRKVDLDGLAVVDNCGTGMDSFKTFNISTAASLVAAAGGVTVARHGARAITSSCGTVDMAESLGVDVECGVDTVAKSIKQAGIGLFNGMSPEVHPMALGRILSRICFGSPLNIAASLAHPALPDKAVRGVYSPELLRPVAEVMQQIGYTDAMVVYGAIDDTDRGMDEGSVCGTTSVVELKNGELKEFSFEPGDCGMTKHSPAALAPDRDRNTATVEMYRLLAGKGEQSRSDAVILNSGLIFMVGNMVSSIGEGVEKARDILLSGRALHTLRNWVEAQNSDPSQGLQRLADLAAAGRSV